MKIRIQANKCFKVPDQSKCRYVVMKGSAGSGKSVDTAQHYILRLMTDPGRNLLCVRKSDVTNRDSTFAELQGAIFRMFGEKWKLYWYMTARIRMYSHTVRHISRIDLLTMAIIAAWNEERKLIRKDIASMA